MWKWKLENGVWGGAGSSLFFEPSHVGRYTWTAPKMSDTPIVATDRMSRGADAKRRTINTSTRKPATSADPIAIANPRSHGMWWTLMSTAAPTADTAPISAWAKLMMRLARYTRIRPNPIIA